VLKEVKPEQLSAHLVAPYAVVAGLIGSVLAALLTRSRRSVAPSAGNHKPAKVSTAQPQVAGDPV
jgi:hypothetical protein